MLFHLDYQQSKVDEIRREWPLLSVEVQNGEGTFFVTGDIDMVEKCINQNNLVDVDDYIRRAEIKQNEKR